jgi:hypothetical protein
MEFIEIFSERVRDIFLIARAHAGNRGGLQLELDDLLNALLLEDQSPAGSSVSRLAGLPEGAERLSVLEHHPFFSSEVAASLAEELRFPLQMGYRSEEVLLSDAVKEVLNRAVELAHANIGIWKPEALFFLPEGTPRLLEEHPVRPLHILSAVIERAPTHPWVNRLRRLGITAESVLRAANKEL